MGYIRAAEESEIIEGKITAVNTRHGRIALTRVNGTIVAFDDVCTHDDGPLSDGELEGEEIICARHGARFNVCTGRATRMPATEDIETYPTRVTGTTVEVDLD